MKYLREYRSSKYVKILVDQIKSVTTKPWKIMEVCGGQTHNIVKYGLAELLPDSIELIHGPGCPVCVTPIEIIDQAIGIASESNNILCTFGDMIRVPGSVASLLSVKSKGADIRIVYSPIDALKIAEQNPAKQVVFFGVGFETTAPANAMAVELASRKQTSNFSVLVSNVRVPPVLKVLLDDSNCQVDGFLAAGNVCTVMGEVEYYNIVDTYQVPIVITGFEPVDILQGIKACVLQLENNQAQLDNQYRRSVKAEGNIPAQQMLDKIFKITDTPWRGLGVIKKGGFVIRSEYAEFDALRKFLRKTMSLSSSKTCHNLCKSGEVLQGKMKPNKCPQFGIKCTPDRPLGAPMVSMEGACHAYYQYLS